MAEAMSVELIIDAYWKMHHYFTIPRVSFKVNRKNKNKGNSGGYSDIDLLAFKPRGKSFIAEETNQNILVFCESKAHGEKNKIFYRDLSKITKIDFTEEKPKDEVIVFIKNIIEVIEQNSLEDLIDFESIDLVKIQYVGTTIFTGSDAYKKAIEDKLVDVLVKKGNSSINVMFEFKTHFDIITSLFILVQADQSAKRYGNVALDLIRELNRFLNVNICYNITSLNFVEDGDKLKLLQDHSKALFENKLKKSKELSAIAFKDKKVKSEKEAIKQQVFDFENDESNDLSKRIFFPLSVNTNK